jgi:thioredoxin-dependent peroxiredoxin
MANQLGINDKFPAVSLLNQDGATVHLADYIGKPLIVYFYPKDDTPGCTAEACTFRDQFSDFTDAGATVFGISGDSPKSHKRFQEKHRLPFDLLSDKDNAFRKQLGIKGNLLGLLPGRVTYVMDKEGVVRHVFTSQFDAKRHVSEALNILKAF